MADLQPVLAALRAESEDLDALVAGLPPDGWARATPAAGWTIAHQIAHLAWTDEIAAHAATDPRAFLDELSRASEGMVDVAAEAGALLPTATLLNRWRTGRAALNGALLATPPTDRIVWFGPPMSPTSMATARLMETWAHGQDIADALGVRRLPTPRLRHVAHLGVRTRDFAYLVRERTPPTQAFRIELTAPDGSSWTWGPEDAAQSVSGPAVDFCLLVTQRRNRGDLDLRAIGDDADAWLDVAQAFAGPPGTGRPPASG